MLHFGADELLWECKEKVACESFPETFPKALFHGWSDQRTQPIYDIWPEIIHRYTSAKLTHGKDKLVALSGIAGVAKDEIVRSGLDDDYIAGMWRRNLENQLWWSIIDRSDRPSPYRVPSWSWASVDGTVIYPSMGVGGQDVVQYAHVLDVRVTPVGTDPFGQVKGGVLKLGCKFMLLGRQEGFRVLVLSPAWRNRVPSRRRYL